MKGDRLPGGDYVARHLRATDYAYGSNGQPAAVYETAFRPKPGENDGLSVIWLNIFQGSIEHQLNCVRSVTSLDVSKTQGMATVRESNRGDNF
jgi:hypothetical protein